MGNIKDMLNGEPFTARIANGMVEVWLRHTERLCHFFLCYGVIRRKRRNIRDQNISIEFFQHLQRSSCRFSMGGLIFLLFSANVFIPVQMGL